MSSIVIMAGGTGGHVFPGIAVADELKSMGWQINWFGTADKMEAQAVPNAGYPIEFLPVKGVRGKGVVTKLVAPFMLLKAVFHALSLLRRLKPNVVLGMGGYASGPGAIAAKLLGIPIIIHEQNAVFGMTNKWLAKIATRVLCGFDVLNSSFASRAPKRLTYIGNPVRKEFLASPNSIDRQGNGKRVLVLGGSLGALALNQIVPSVLKELSTHYHFNIKHQGGKSKCDPLNQAYAWSENTPHQVEVSEFIDDIPNAMHWADVIICRSGALTVAEVSNTGKAAIFVPLPIAVDDHQTYNAKTLTEHGAGILIQQNKLQEQLGQAIHDLLSDENKLTQMSKRAKSLGIPNAAKLAAKICVDVVEG